MFNIFVIFFVLINIKMIVSGWIFIDFLNNNGLIKFLFNCWIIKIDNVMYKVWNGEINKLIMIVGIVLIKGLIYGIIFVML